MSSFLSKIGLCGYKRIIDNEVDVRIVGVEKLDNVSNIRVVQK